MLLIYIASLILYRYGLFFFLHDTPTTEIYTYGHTLSLHDALPIYCIACAVSLENHGRPGDALPARLRASVAGIRAAFAGRPRQGLRQCRYPGVRKRSRRARCAGDAARRARGRAWQEGAARRDFAGDVRTRASARTRRRPVRQIGRAHV